MVNDKIGQFTILWMHRYHHQCASSSRGCILYNAFIVKKRSFNINTTYGSYVITIDTKRYAITCSILNSTIREVHNFPKETPLLHTYMSETTCRRIKNYVQQDAVFTIGEEYLTAKMELLHLGDQGC